MKLIELTEARRHERLNRDVWERLVSELDRVSAQRGLDDGYGWWMLPQPEARLSVIRMVGRDMWAGGPRFPNDPEKESGDVARPCLLVAVDRHRNGRWGDDDTDTCTVAASWLNKRGSFETFGLLANWSVSVVDMLGMLEPIEPVQPNKIDPAPAHLGGFIGPPL